MSASDKLEAAAKTFKAKAAEYGENYMYVGDMLEAMFPEGITLKCQPQFTRMHLLVMMCVKLSRYAVNFHNGGHQDSVHDLTVYAAMLEQMDEEVMARCVDNFREAVARMPDEKNSAFQIL